MLRLALPYYKNFPPHTSQASNGGLVPPHVPGKFRQPIASIGFRGAGIEASLLRMLVPETAMNEYRLLMGPPDDVWLAGKFLGVEAEAEPEPVRQ